MSASPNHERAWELLALRATEGLSDEQLREVMESLDPSEGLTLDALDHAAAATDYTLQMEQGVEEMPSEIRSLCITQARQWVPAGVFGGESAEGRILDSDASEPIGRIEAGGRLSHPTDVDFTRDGLQDRPSMGSGSFAMGGGGAGLPWLLAAASFLLAVIGWLRPATNTPPMPSDARPSLAQVMSAPDVVEASWAPQDDPAAENAGGRVIWSDDLQAGYMVFEGLAALDPDEAVYQLWIFDPERPQETPVDGGVFTIPAGQPRVEVPIDAKLPVSDPNLFAITIEEPGGVVVSKRERLPLVAKPEAATSSAS